MKIFLIVFCFLSCSLFADTGSHPRLFFSTNDIPDLKNKILTGTAKDVYDLMKSKADSYLSISTTPYNFEGAIAGRTLSRQLFTLALTGILSDDSKYTDKAIDILQAAVNQADVNTFSNFNGHLAVGDGTQAYAVSYDWLFSFMTFSQRTNVENELQEFGAWLHNELLTGYVGDNEPRRLASNHNAVVSGGLGLCALALGADASTAWLSKATYQISNYFNYALDSTGCPYEGMTYLLYAFQGAIPFSEALRRSGGVDIISQNSDVLRAVPKFFMHQLYPWGSEGVAINQTGNVMSPAGAISYLITKFQDMTGLWGWNRFVGKSGDNNYGWISWRGTGASLPYVVLWCDNNLTSKFPDSLAKHFARGQISARDGWSNNDSFVSFTSGTGWAGCWNHSDENSFTFAAKGEKFAIDPGAGYTTSTNHNTIMVDGIGQNNDGHAGLVEGEIVTFINNNDYVYVLGDATSAYDVKANAKRARRQLIYVRAPQPYALISDDFEVNDSANHLFSFLLHSDVNNIFNITSSNVYINGASAVCSLNCLWPATPGISETHFTSGLENVYKELIIQTTAKNPRFMILLVAASTNEALPAVSKSGDDSSMTVELLFSSGRKDTLTVMQNDINFSTEPPPVICTNGNWAFWHMDSRTNLTDPPSLPWYIPDNSANLCRDNFLNISGHDVTAGGFSGNYLNFTGDWRAISTKDWINSDGFYFECDIKPDCFDKEQRIFEITQAVSIRFSPNSGHNYGRIRFVSYDDSSAIDDLYSGWCTSDSVSNQWIHIACSIDYAGNKIVAMTGADNGTSIVNSIHAAYVSDPRAFVGGDRLNGNLFIGGIDEVKVNAIPEPCYSLFIMFQFLFISRLKKY